jgi:hypothetical protein
MHLTRGQMFKKDAAQRVPAGMYSAAHERSARASLHALSDGRGHFRRRCVATGEERPSPENHKPDDESRQQAVENDDFRRALKQPGRRIFVHGA